MKIWLANLKRKLKKVVKNLTNYDEKLYQRLVNNLVEINKLFEEIEENFTTSDICES